MHWSPHDRRRIVARITHRLSIAPVVQELPQWLLICRAHGWPPFVKLNRHHSNYSLNKGSPVCRLISPVRGLLLSLRSAHCLSINQSEVRTHAHILIPPVSIKVPGFYFAQR